MDLRKHGWLGQGGNDMCACLCVAQSKKSTLMRAAAFEFFLSSGTMTDTFVDSSAELTSVLIFQMFFFLGAYCHTAELPWMDTKEGAPVQGVCFSEHSRYGGHEGRSPIKGFSACGSGRLEPDAAHKHWSKHNFIEYFGTVFLGI
jgi:hypothetical protein